MAGWSVTITVDGPITLDPAIARDLISDTTEGVASKARVIVPVDTGQLRSSIFTQMNAGGGLAGWVGIVGASAHYALFVHEGTGLYGPRKAMIVAKPGRVFHWIDKGGNSVFTTKIRGSRPQPFLVNAAKDSGLRLG